MGGIVRHTHSFRTKRKERNAPTGQNENKEKSDMESELSNRIFLVFPGCHGIRQAAERRPARGEGSAVTKNF